MGEPYPASAFDYDYPPGAVAQHPLPDRAASRLLVLERTSGAVFHQSFRDFPTLLQPPDVVVVNTSRVIPARLCGTRQGGGKAEVLLVQGEADGTWLALVHPGSRLREGRTVRFGDEGAAEIVSIEPGGLRRIRFSGAAPAQTIMDRYGSVPLPPYIDREPVAADRERYQTVYAAADGSVAAPTAGLHFTTDMLTRIRDRGITIAEIVLHIGPGTFRPVEVEDPTQHRMHAEAFEVSRRAASVINRAKARGGRVWAIGTTVARALETVATGRSAVTARSGWTDLFIYPPFTFSVVDRLLTNFHLPRSTLLMLVAAFAGYETTMAAYREAVARGYRLFSYGDAMAVI